MSGGITSVTLPEISVGPDLNGGALPGNGSYGDPISGFHQINQQFADGQRAFSEATANRSNEINAQFQAQNEARNAQFQAWADADLARMNDQRAALFAQPPITGPILPPNFSETAGASPQPASVPSMPRPVGGPEGRPVTAGAIGVAAVPTGTGVSVAFPSAGQVLGAAGDLIGGLALRGGLLGGALLGLGTGTIPSDADEAATRAQTEERLRATGTRPGSPPAGEDQAPPGAMDAEGAEPALPSPFGPVPSFVAAGLPAQQPWKLPSPFTSNTDGDFMALPGLTPVPTSAGNKGPTLPPDLGPLPAFVPQTPPGPTLPGLQPAGQMLVLPGFDAAGQELVGIQGFENRVPGPFASNDPLVGDLANTLDAALPGLVAGVNVDVLRADGTKLTDYDIQLTNSTVIQVKAGGGKGLTAQMEATAAVTGQRVIAYGPNLGGTLEKSLRQRGYEVYRDPQSLIDALRRQP